MHGLRSWLTTRGGEAHRKDANAAFTDLHMNPSASLHKRCRALKTDIRSACSGPLEKSEKMVHIVAFSATFARTPSPGMNSIAFVSDQFALAQAFITRLAALLGQPASCLKIVARRSKQASAEESASAARRIEMRFVAPDPAVAASVMQQLSSCVTACWRGSL